LEGQWQPEETTADALRRRVKEGTLGKGDYEENPFAAELLQVLDDLERPNVVLSGARAGLDEA